MANALNPTTERANIRFLYADMLTIGLAFAMEWYYLQVYAIHLGATAFQLGVLNSGRALLLVVGSALSNRWQRQFTNAITALRVPSLVYKILLYLAIAFVPFMPNHQVDLMVALVVISAIPTGIAQGIFLGMMPFAVTKDKLARVVSQRGVLMNATVLACVFLLGQFLEWLPRPANYQAGFVLAFLVSFASWSAIQNIKIPDVVNVAAVTRSINVWKFVPFRRFALVIFVLNTSVFMAGPLIPLQLVNGLNASDAWISLLGIFEMAAGALLTYFTPRLVRRFGARKLIIATTFATVFNVLTLALTPTLPPYIIGTTIWGAGWFAVNILLYNRLVEIVPQEDVRQYAAMYQILLNVALFIGPLIGTFLIEGLMTLPAALLLIAGVRFVAGVLAWAIRIEPHGETATLAVEAVKAS